VTKAKKDAADSTDELREKLRDCQETREQLEEDNELLRESSITFGDLAERLAMEKGGKLSRKPG
jgi:hypothetical protein